MSATECMISGEADCAVHLVDGHAQYQLLAERVSLILSGRHTNKRFEMTITFKPYTADRLVQLLREREVFFRPAKDEPGSTDIERGSMELDRAFFDEHLLSVEFQGRSLRTDEIERLDARFAIKVNAVNAGLNGIHTEIDEEAELSLDDLFEDSASIAQYAHFCDASKQEVRVDMTHHFRAPMGSDSIAYGRTAKVRTAEGGIQQYKVNYASRLKLYDALIESADGLLLGETSCTAANKAEWLPKVPAFFKLAALEQLFKGSSRKNG